MLTKIDSLLVHGVNKAITSCFALIQALGLKSVVQSIDL